jgi:hypothetical protein
VDEDDYVDVVSDGKNNSTVTKVQRQAHIELYR